MLMSLLSGFGLCSKYVQRPSCVLALEYAKLQKVVLLGSLLEAVLGCQHP